MVHSGQWRLSGSFRGDATASLGPQSTALLLFSCSRTTSYLFPPLSLPWVFTDEPHFTSRGRGKEEVVPSFGPLGDSVPCIGVMFSKIAPRNNQAGVIWGSFQTVSIWNRTHVWLLCFPQGLPHSTWSEHHWIATPQSFIHQHWGLPRGWNKVVLFWIPPGEVCPRKRTVVEKICIRNGEQIQAPQVNREGGWLCPKARRKTESTDVFWGREVLPLNPGWRWQRRKLELSISRFAGGILETSPSNSFLK